jgi:hypothetical protein
MAARKGRLTPAGAFVRDWLGANDKDQQWLVDELNRRREAQGFTDRTSRICLWRWMTGKHVINIDDATLIAEITGLPTKLWSRFGGKAA